MLLNTGPLGREPRRFLTLHITPVREVAKSRFGGFSSPWYPVGVIARRTVASFDP